MKKKIIIPPLSNSAAFIARRCLPFIVFSFAYILSELMCAPQNERAWAAFTAFSMLEYAMMCLTMTFCCVVTVDIFVKQNTK